MLASNQVRASVRGGRLRPRWVDPESPETSGLADDATSAAQAALDGRWSRGQLERELQEIAASSRDRRLAEGLAKLVVDRCEFCAAVEDIDPAALREQAFRRAQEVGPLSLVAGPFGARTAADVLAEIAGERGLPADVIATALFGDLREAHRILAYEPIAPRELLDRYNVALVQGLLLSALEVRVEIDGPTPARIRQVLRRARFHQLICSAVRRGDRLVVTLDGPASLFNQSTRYGLALASFFPALLLQEAPWRLAATVLWTRARQRRELEVSSADGLRPIGRDVGGYLSREASWFEERFKAAESDWGIAAATAPIDLGGRAVVVPDFTITRGDRTAHIEILGYWRSDWLERRLELVRQYGPGNLVIAVSRRLCAEERPRDGWGPEVVEFAQVVPPKEVLAIVERIAI